MKKIVVTGLSSISNWSTAQPTKTENSGISLTPPSGVTPQSAITGSVATDGTVTVGAVNLTADSQDAYTQTAWTITVEWDNSSSKAVTITANDIKPSYSESNEGTLTFDLSGCTLNIAE